MRPGGICVSIFLTAILLLGAGEATAAAIANWSKSARSWNNSHKKASPAMPLAGLSVALTASALKGLGAACAGVAITMVFPDPNRAKIQVVRDYQSAMRAIGQQEFSSISLESYINTRVLAEGLERAGRDLTRAKLRTALRGLQNLDIGGFSVDYPAAAPFVGSQYVDLGVLGAGGRFIG